MNRHLVQDVPTSFGESIVDDVLIDHPLAQCIGSVQPRFDAEVVHSRSIAARMVCNDAQTFYVLLMFVLLVELAVQCDVRVWTQMKVVGSRRLVGHECGTGGQ